MHKKLGNTHLAMMNFSWANDLDPKGLNNQIKVAVDKRYVTEDDDPLARLEQDSSEYTCKWLMTNFLALKQQLCVK